MKITATLAFLTGLLGAGLLGAGGPAAGTTPTADEILERNLAALGGKARMQAVRTLRFTATQWSGGATGQSAPMTVYWKRPDRLRIEAPEEGLLKVLAFDGTTAWSTYPELEGFRPQVFEGAERDSLREQADLVDGPTVDYAAKGHHVELAGREDLGSGAAWKILLTTAQGEVRTLWFDCETFLQVREERTQKVAGQEITTVSLLSDFRPAGGILFAHRTESRQREPGGPPEGTGEPAVFAIQTLELDVEIPDSLFAMPTPVAVPEPASAAPAPAAGPR